MLLEDARRLLLSCSSPRVYIEVCVARDNQIAWVLRLLDCKVHIFRILKQGKPYIGCYQENIQLYYF